MFSGLSVSARPRNSRPFGPKAGRGEWTRAPDLRAFYLCRSDAEVKWKGP